MINFLQNDDWLYYQVVREFLQGNFILPTTTAPTFYLQGLLAVLWSKVFGISTLYILTLLVSIGCLGVFYAILKIGLKKSNVICVIGTALLAVNPLFIYSSLGFMTENYFMLFFLLSILYFYKYLNSGKKLDFANMNIFVILSLFVRQIGLLTAFTFSIYFLIHKRFKEALGQFGIFLGLVGYYYFLFPRTLEMQSKNVSVEYLATSQVSFSTVYAILIYLCAFTLPLAIEYFISSPRLLKLLLWGPIIALTVYISFNISFKPNKLAWGEFYYFENTLEQKGFYPRGIEGTKYHFKGIYDLYRYWDTLAKVAVALVLAGFILNKHKQIKSFEFWFIVGYISLLLVTVKVFDRYILVLLPVFIIFLTKHLENYKFFAKLILAFFIIALGSYSYLLALDFIQVNNYIWHKGTELSLANNIEPKYILGNSAWRKSYLNTEGDYKYMFTFDNLTANPELTCCWSIQEEKTFKYPVSFFIEPKVFLYKSKGLYLGNL